MMVENENIAELIKKHWLGQLSESEHAILAAWTNENPQNREFVDHIITRDFLKTSDAEYRDFDKLAIAAGIQKEFPFVFTENLIAGRIVHRVHFLKTAWFRYAAAILIVIGIGAYLWNNKAGKQNPAVSQTVSVQADILPASAKAILLLSDGRKIELNSKARETIKEGSLSIINKNGQLVYQNGKTVAINSMSTPRGGQYKLTLSDGTKVWLNAASSITYPTAFTGSKREVSIAGEAYFEVSADKTKPFVVKTPQDEIVVLGTAFNINAYADEPAEKTSLLSGSVKVSGQIIKPGQAFINGKITVANIANDIAWKNGVFAFDNADVKGVMRQLSRWYDIDIVYSGNLPQGNFKGDIGRDLKLAEVLDVLATYGIKYNINGRKVSIGN